MFSTILLYTAAPYVAVSCVAVVVNNEIFEVTYLDMSIYQRQKSNIYIRKGEVALITQLLNFHTSDYINWQSMLNVKITLIIDCTHFNIQQYECLIFR